MTATTAAPGTVLPPLKEIPYVKILEFAAKRALRAGIGKDRGFTLQEIRSALPVSLMSDEWLRELLPSICTVRIDEKVVEKPDEAAVLDPTATFVIKSEEYLKLIASHQVERVAALTVSSIEHFHTVAEEAKKTAAAAEANAVVADKSLKKAEDGVLIGWIGLGVAIVAMAVSTGFEIVSKPTLRLSSADSAAIYSALTVAKEQRELQKDLVALVEGEAKSVRVIAIDSVQYGCLLYATRTIYPSRPCPQSFSRLARQQRK